MMRVNLLAAPRQTASTSTRSISTGAATRGVHQAGGRSRLGSRKRSIKHDLGHVLLKLEELQDEQIRRRSNRSEADIAHERGGARSGAGPVAGSETLLDRILEDFERCGVVGEETNKLVGYLAAVSRQSGSAAGGDRAVELRRRQKLADGCGAGFVPEEERVQYSAMTGQSLFYMGETGSEAQGAGHRRRRRRAARAAYALKLLQSEGELTSPPPARTRRPGKLVTHQYRVEGPVMIFLTTTAIDLDEELLNRCLVLTVNEDREQTQAIHALQREQQTLEGLLRKRRARGHPDALHQNAQRLLEAAVRGESLRAAS